MNFVTSVLSQFINNIYSTKRWFLTAIPYNLYLVNNMKYDWRSLFSHFLLFRNWTSLFEYIFTTSSLHKNKIHYLVNPKLRILFSIELKWILICNSYAHGNDSVSFFLFVIQCTKGVKLDQCMKYLPRLNREYFYRNCSRVLDEMIISWPKHLNGIIPKSNK